MVVDIRCFELFPDWSTSAENTGIFLKPLSKYGLHYTDFERNSNCAQRGWTFHVELYQKSGKKYGK